MVIKICFAGEKINKYQNLIDDLTLKLADLNQCYSLIELNNQELDKLLSSFNEISQNDCKKETEKEIFDSIHNKAKALKLCLNLVINNMKKFTNLAKELEDEKENRMESEFLKRRE